MKCLLSFNIAFLFGVLPIFAMERLSKDELSWVQDHIRQIERAEEMGSSYFMTSGQTNGYFISSHLQKIEEIFDKHNIPHPLEVTWHWLENIKSEIKEIQERLGQASFITPAAQAQSSPDKDKDECDISGLNKVDVLLALWNGASTNFWSVERKLTREDALLVLNKNPSIDYLGGKPLKVNLKGNTFNTYLYNRDNGAGLAQKIIAELRK